MVLNANVEVRDIDGLARFLEEMLEKYGNKVIEQMAKDNNSVLEESWIIFSGLETTERTIFGAFLFFMI